MNRYEFYQLGNNDDSDKTIIWKVNRNIGVRMAFLFYKLGFSANGLSMLRCLIAVAGIYFFTYLTLGKTLLPFFGLLLMIIQINLDFADGVIARATNTVSRIYGQKFDALANDLSRAGIIIIIGYLANNTAIFVISIFSGLILTYFWNLTAQDVFSALKTKYFRKLYIISSSVILVNVLLPLCIIVLNLFFETFESAYVLIASLYGLLSLLWLVTSSIVLDK